MAEVELATLGKRLAELRIARQLKQTELAYEAGVSHRTLQRLEAGKVVKVDALLKVIKCLGRLDAVMTALDFGVFSPYEMLADAGLKVSQLSKQRPVKLGAAQDRDAGGTKPAAPRRRVRRPRAAGPAAGKPPGRPSKAVQVQWPEDQQ